MKKVLLVTFLVIVPGSIPIYIGYKIFKKIADKIVMVTAALLITQQAWAGMNEEVFDLANKNHLKPSNRVVAAIVHAGESYGISPLELAAISVVETGMGKYNSIHKNKNGTVDKGLFQINTVNHKYCIEYTLDTPEGNSLCAAKLLANIKYKYLKDPKHLGRYNSNTPKYKQLYYQKVAKVLENYTER